jgi:hypothetical protein
MKGASANPVPTSHSGMPSHRNVSKSQFDPISPVSSHPAYPRHTSLVGSRLRPPSGSGGKTSLQDFPWICFQQIVCSETTPPWRGTTQGLPSPCFPDRPKGAAGQGFGGGNSYRVEAILSLPVLPTATAEDVSAVGIVRY